jgi:hypothetical protein
MRHFSIIEKRAKNITEQNDDFLKITPPDKKVWIKLVFVCQFGS